MNRPAKRNPAAAGTADGVTKPILIEGKDTSPAPALQSGTGDGFTRDRLKWLEAVTDAATLPKAAHRVAAKLALRFLSRERGIAWPSVVTLAESLGVDRKAILAAIAALEAAGFLAVVRSKGRGHANEYTLTIPPRKGGENATFSDGRKGGGNDTFSTPLKGGVSAREKVVKMPPHPFEEPSEGAGARSRARPTPPQGEREGELQRPVSDTGGHSGAHERADVSPAPELDPFSHHAAETETDAADDLDWLSEPPDPVTLAAVALGDLHGDALDDPEGLAADLVDGFADDDGEAATRAARRVAKLLLAEADARDTWAEHKRILHRAVMDCTASKSRADAAVSALFTAVGVQGTAIKAARARAAIETDTADQGAAHG